MPNPQDRDTVRSMDFDPRRHSVLAKHVEDVVDAFSDERFAVAWRRARAHVAHLDDVDDEDAAIAGRFAFEVSKMAWQIILGELVEDGDVETIVDVDGIVHYFPAALRDDEDEGEEHPA